MNNRSFVLLAAAAISGTAIASSSVAQADPTLDRLLASQCAQCHGTDGRAVGDIDSLAWRGV